MRNATWAANPLPVMRHGTPPEPLERHLAPSTGKPRPEPPEHPEPAPRRTLSPCSRGRPPDPPSGLPAGLPHARA